MTEKVAVLGCGAWGSALAAPWREGELTVMGWHRSSDDSVLADAMTIIAAVPAQATREVLSRVAPALRAGATIVLAAKGLERETLARQSQVAADVLPDHPVAVLSGPGFADDLIAGLPTALTLATDRPEAEMLQAMLSTPALRLYLSDDLIGTELGGALKNVIAIACGATMGAGLGESARAALMARGFAEMARIALAAGGRAETLGGLSGLGDLTLTATSAQSRNYRYGLALGRTGRAPTDGTFEGASTADAAVGLAKRLHVDAPLIATTAALVAGRIGVQEAVVTLMRRPLRRE